MVAEVLSVSTGAVQGRAVVMRVSYWPVSAVAVREKFAQHSLIVGVSAK